MTCDERRDAVLLFAAGLLDEAEAAPLRAHLASGCEACARELALARQVENALALAAPDDGRAARAARGAAAAHPARSAPDGEGSGARAAELASPRARCGPRRGARRAGRVLARVDPSRGDPRGAHRSARRRSRRRAEEMAEQEEELAELEATSRILESDLERAHRQVAMLSELTLVTLDLKPAMGIDRTAQARVFWEWDDYYCYLHAEGLRAADAPAVYALWLETEDGNRVLAGTFSTEGGHGTLWVQLPRDMGRAVRAQVTLEPAPPGPTPAGAVQLTSGPRRAL